jgi:hypothetical protein
MGEQACSCRDSRRGCLRRALPGGPGKQSASARVVAGDSPAKGVTPTPAFFGRSTDRTVTHPSPHAPWKLPQGSVLDYLGRAGSRQWDGTEACPKPSPQTGLDRHFSLRGLLPAIPSGFFRFFHFCLTSRPILSNNYFVLPDGFGGVSVWRKFGCKRVNPLRTRCAASSAKYSRKILSRRSSATPFT